MPDFDADLLNTIPAEPADGAFLETLAAKLREQRKWDDLLNVRLMQARLQSGLAVDAESIADAPPDARRQAEQAYADACEEVGLGLLADATTSAGGWRDAWFYLNTAGKPDAMRAALRTVTPEMLAEDEELAEELIEVALHQGANPPLGFRWLIVRFGTCNAVTQLEGLGPHLPVGDLTGCAAVLVEHLHAELTANLRGHIEREEGRLPTEDTLPGLIADRPWLFEHEAAHVDASHLSAAVRMARVLEDPEHVRPALELAEYGARLHPSLHYADAPPFEELYESHRLFFSAQLGGEVDEAVGYFRPRAQQARPEIDGLAALETLMVLLSRVGHGGEALRVYGELAPVGAALSPYAPRPIDLARASGDWEAYEQVMRTRGDLVAIAQGRLVRSAAER